MNMTPVTRQELQTLRLTALDTIKQESIKKSVKSFYDSILKNASGFDCKEKTFTATARLTQTIVRFYSHPYNRGVQDYQVNLDYINDILGLLQQLFPDSKITYTAIVEIPGGTSIPINELNDFLKKSLHPESVQKMTLTINWE